MHDHPADDTPPAPPSPAQFSRLGEIGALFARLGLLGFGGPLTLVAMMEEETTRKRNWVTPTRFGEMYSVCKVLPGPVSTQMAIFMGYVRGGVPGGLLAGVLLILPAFFLVLAASYFYLNTSVTQNFAPVFSGLQAGALAVILTSGLALGKPFRKYKRAWLIGSVSAGIIYFKPSWEPLVLLAFGIPAALSYQARSKQTARSFAAPLLAMVSGLLSANGGAGLASSALPFSGKLLAQLFWTCFKAGAFVFGTGLAIVPMLEGDVVLKHHWLTHAEFMDGLALGQVTPGPVVITATFIGFKTAGILGAVLATAAIFLPSFINILVILPKLWNRIAGTPASEGFTAYALPAVVGGILGTTLKLALASLVSAKLVLLFAACFALSFLRKTPAWVIIPLAAAVSAIF